MVIPPKNWPLFPPKRTWACPAEIPPQGGDNVEVYSAGSRPSGIVNPKAVESMREMGYDLTKHSSKSLDEISRIEYDFVATMGCGDECPLVRAKRREDWEIPDPKNLLADQFRETRDLIEEKVKSALAALGKSLVPFSA